MLSDALNSETSAEVSNSIQIIEWRHVLSATRSKTLIQTKGFSQHQSLLNILPVVDFLLSMFLFHSHINENDIRDQAILPPWVLQRKRGRQHGQKQIFCDSREGRNGSYEGELP